MTRSDEVSDQAVSPEAQIASHLTTEAKIASHLTTELNQTQSDTEILVTTQRQYADDAWEESEPTPPTHSRPALLPDPHHQYGKNRV